MKEYIRFGDINMYIVAGIVVGYGSDSEPLLRNVKVVKKLNIKSFRS